MSNEMATVDKGSALFKTLQFSIYPGAASQSVEMVLAYCAAAKLDPMTKPVHIVPIWDSKIGGMRDVVMPGIGLYRIQAARTGCAGIGEPEFGPVVSAKIGGVDISYPEWCRVTVKRRLETGEIAEFTAKELWLENYAVKGGKEKSIAPNAMWHKRAFGQLAKCAEAQALRKAFPEIGSAPTAEEMEGKAINGEIVIEAVAVDAPVPSPELLAAAETAANNGMDAYKAQWKLFTPDEKKLLVDYHDGFKSTAMQADERLLDEAIVAESEA
jgi:phage recombination protein Bet